MILWIHFDNYSFTLTKNLPFSLFSSIFVANSDKVLAHDLLPISENETLLYLGRLQTLSPTLD